MPPDPPADLVSSTKVAPARAHFRLNATPFDVRRALEKLRTTLHGSGVTTEVQDTTEQVLAEVLNNIVEHALAGRETAQIEVTVDFFGNSLTAFIRDDGREMPDGSLPLGRLSPLGDTLDSLPEGGFGWYMINHLTEGLIYRREPGWNTLSFRISGIHLKGLS